MAMRSTQPLTEMSIRDHPGGKDRPALKTATSPPAMNRFFRKWGSLDISQAYGPQRPFTGIASPSHTKSCFGGGGMVR
jgi:hypothetical protein